MHKAIQTYLADLLPMCSSAGLLLTGEREIGYGIQLIFTAENHSINLNIYYSEKKKSLSTVIGGAPGNPLRKKLEGCISLPPAQSTAQQVSLHTWESWIGSDECGKGDYFGALVVGSFFMQSRDVKQLTSLGVCDSKMLRDNQIEVIAKRIYAAFPDRSEVFVLKPAKYNLLYADFSRQKKNLNDLLAWQHVKNIETLLSRFPKTQGVLIDQFSKNKKVHQALAKKHHGLSVIERPGAEADLAVATASILARYQFVQQFRTMSNFYKITFPKGAAHNIKQTANEYVRQFGFHRLNEVAKLHFKTTLEIEQREIV